MAIDILPMTVHEERYARRGALDMKTEDDGELLRLAGKGRQDAWEELVRRFDGLIHRVAKGKGLNNSDADDVAQVTWLRLSGSIERLRDADRIAGWLVTTARRESVRVAMRGDRQIPSADPVSNYAKDGRADVGSAADSEFLDGEYDPEVENALGRLPLQQQRLLRLLVSDADLSYAQVSNALGIPVGSIGPMRQRALSSMRRML